MAGAVGIGIEDFGEIIQNDYFYVDKTAFIREWWENGAAVTLIARPRRFGKTLNMSMLEQFFSVDYAGRGNLFEGLAIWEDGKYRELQGTYPVISLSFASVKAGSFQSAREQICQLIAELYLKNAFLKRCDWMVKGEREFFDSVRQGMSEVVATLAISMLCGFLYRYYGKNPIILLDGYDTPMQEACLGGYQDDLVGFLRSLFCSTFKANRHLGRAVIMGMTGIGMDHHFSDMNHLEVVATRYEKYAGFFGFTESEVSDALDEHGLSEEKHQLIPWYGSAAFGWQEDIYNPWFILNFLSNGDVRAYWDNISFNELAGQLLREGSHYLKERFESLLRNESIWIHIDEQVVYSRLGQYEDAVWSLLLANGCLKVLNIRQKERLEEWKEPIYELAFTNQDVRQVFSDMVRGWFGKAEEDYNGFVSALLQGDLEAMNACMNCVALKTFRYFDTGKGPAGAEPDRFYHGLVLGLMVELQDRYHITSNRESGFWRYDVMLEPENSVTDDAMILEFKVHDPEDEATLEDTVAAALKQIEEKQYGVQLMGKGIPAERIRSYGFAFEGKKVLIGNKDMK